MKNATGAARAVAFRFAAARPAASAAERS